MNNLQHRQQKIQEKRKQTPWKEFVKEIASWKSMVLAKNNGLISRYPPVRVTNVHSLEKRYTQADQGIKDLPFFEQLGSLFGAIGRPALVHFYKNENADFSDSSFGSKNVYLSFEAGDDAENIVYSNLVYTNAKNIFGSSSIGCNVENIIDSNLVGNSSFVFYSTKVYDSHHIYYCKDLIGCSDCILCFGIQNKNYCIGNKQYTKKEYAIQKKLLLKNHKKLGALYQEQISNKKVNTNHKCEATTNTVQSSHMYDSRNIIFGAGGGGARNCFDSITVGLDSEHIYCCVAVGDHSSHLYCSVEVGRSHSIYYSYHLDTCSFCFGCIGLKNKSYCIFNKQYTKEERHQKVDEIFTQMEKDGDLGKFFPPSMNPFYFNDTAAALIEGFDREEIIAEGYLRRDEEIAVDIPDWMDVVAVKDLGDYESFDSNGNWTIDPSILKKVIKDEEGNVYRVIKMEYDFLVKHGLPLPRKHRLERLKGHFRIK